MTYSRLVQAYPQFVADQVLTQDQLNNMRIFLDSQNRATRVKLVGIGIVCGLHASVGDVDIIDKISGDVIDTVPGITISEGYGVTSDGWFICIPEMKYVHIQDYEDPDYDEKKDGDDVIIEPRYRHWRIAFPNDEQNGADNTQIPIRRLLEGEDVINGSTPLNVDPASGDNDLSEKVLLLYLEINEEELKSCFTTDCNNKGQSINLEVEALLVDKDEERFFPGAVQCNRLEELQYVPRFNTAISKISNPVNDISEIDKPAQIKRAYSHICDFVSQELTTRIQDFYNEYEQFFCLSEFENDFAIVSDQLLALKDDPDLNQYNFDILKDIAQAYNECIHQACKILKKCCSEEYFPRHLVIRDFVVSDNGNWIKSKGWRHPFYPSAVNNVIHQDLEKVRLLFARLLQLINGYLIRERLPQEGIKITPSYSEFQPLATRAIPFYYNISIEDTWDLDACCNEPAIGYHWNNMALPTDANYLGYRENPLHYNLNANNFLRIEGHLGLDRNDAYDRIETLRAAHNLDFQIIGLPLEPTNPYVDPPIDATNIYQNIGKEWTEVYNRIASGEISASEYDVQIDKIKSQQNEIIIAIDEWCKGQSVLDLQCDYSHLQADYNVLKAELLCLLNTCKPAFNQSPDISFEETCCGESEGKICTDFSILEDGASYGGGNNEIGERVIIQNGIEIFVEEFIDDAGNLAFGKATVNKAGPNIFIGNVNFKFVLNSSSLGFTTNRVEIIFEDGGGIENLGINNFSLIPIEFSDHIDQTIDIPSAPEYTLEIQKFDGRFRGIVSGPEIQSITLGGQEFALYELCAYGDSGNSSIEPKSLPDLTFKSRLDRLKLLCDLLEKMLHQDIRCFHFPLFQRAVKDFAGTAIEIKLWLHCIFNSVDGRFLPYKFFPNWNDLEDCLDHIHTNCLYPRFSTLYHIFLQSILANLKSFGNLAKRYPGMEHRAGVSMGGTFIIVYESESNSRVLADFSLEHYVEECCTCQLDMSSLRLPLVALADYRIVNLSEDERKIEIAVLENDFDLGENGDFKLEAAQAATSDQGATLSFDIDSGIVTYDYSNMREGVDHFTYVVANNHSKDIGHVYIGLFEEGKPDNPSEMGKTRGKVLSARDESTPVSGAKVDVVDSNGNIVDSDNTVNGNFSVAVIEGIYTLKISHPFYSNDSIPNQQIDGGRENILGPFFLKPNEAITDRINSNGAAIETLRGSLATAASFPSIEIFVNETTTNPVISIAELSESYNDASRILLEDIENAQGSKRKELVKLLTVLNHSYLDRVVVENPDEADPKVLESITKTKKAMVKSNVSSDTILKNWKSDQLKASLDGRGNAIQNLEDIFKTGT